MADKRQHLAQMNAVKLADAIPDEATADLIANQGGRSLLLVEAIHGPYVTAVDGTQTLSLLPGVVVLVPDEHAKPVRDLLRGLAVGGDQAITYEDAGDAFVPPTEQSAAAVQAAADKASADAADPEAPLPTPAGPEGDGGNLASDGDPEGPWPGDEGYEAPGDTPTDPAPTTDTAGDDLAAKRARGGRAKAAGA